MGRSGGRVTLACSIEGCPSQAKHVCGVCAHQYCSAHGQWIRAVQVGALRGRVRPEASIWLCTLCSTRLGVGVLPVPPRRR
jgi:hypothetical protein